MSKNTKIPDRILTDAGYVRALSLDPETELSIKGRKFKAKDIPWVVYTLKCGHKGKGIAINNQDAIFCDSCKEISFVESSRR